MAVRPCAVTFTDERGSTHRVQVSAASAFEAAALAVHAFRSQEWVPPVGPTTRLVVEVRHPTVQHEVTVSAVRRWAKATPTSPADLLHRQRLQDLLAKP